MRLVVSLYSKNDSATADPEIEAVGALLGIADKIARGSAEGLVFDLNGNRIGNWLFEADADPDEREEALFRLAGF